MPRRRRNLASVMANRRPQREAVERGKAPEINVFSVLEESAQLVLELSERMFYEAQVSCVGQMWKMPNVPEKSRVHHTKTNFNIKHGLFPQFLLSIYNMSHYLISLPFFLFPLLLIKS